LILLYSRHFTTAAAGSTDYLMKIKGDYEKIPVLSITKQVEKIGKESG